LWLLIDNYNVLNQKAADKYPKSRKILEGVERTEAAQSTQSFQNRQKEAREIIRLTPIDYANAGILSLYDWSVKDREAHDREMAKYRRYLMKLCTLSHEVDNKLGQETK
jgi:hypothetical protein